MADEPSTGRTNPPPTRVPLYRDEQWSVIHRMMAGLRNARMDVFRSARQDWSNKWPNTPIVLVNGERPRFSSIGPTEDQNVTGAIIRNLGPGDFLGVDLSRINFINPNVDKPAAIKLLEKVGAKIQDYTIGKERHTYTTVGTAPAMPALTLAQKIQRAGRFLRRLENQPGLFKAEVGDWRDMYPAPEILSLVQDDGSVPRVNFTSFTAADFERIDFADRKNNEATKFDDAIMPSVEFAQMLQSKGAVIRGFTVGDQHYDAPPPPATTVATIAAATKVVPVAASAREDVVAIHAKKQIAAPEARAPRIDVDLRRRLIEALQNNDPATLRQLVAGWRAQHAEAVLPLGPALAAMGQAGAIGQVDFTLFRREDFAGIDLKGAIFIGAVLPRGSMNPPNAITEAFLQKEGAVLQASVLKAVNWKAQPVRVTGIAAATSQENLVVPDEALFRRLCVTLQSGGAYFRAEVERWREQHPGKILDLGGAFQALSGASVSNVDFERFSRKDFAGVNLRGAKFLGAYLSQNSDVSKSWLEDQGVIWDICYIMDGVRNNVPAPTSPARPGR